MSEPSLRTLRVSLRFSSRSASSSTRRERTMLPRLRLYLRILNSKTSPKSLSRLRTGRRSTCDPGRNALTPMSTCMPPLTREVMVPLTVPSCSKISPTFSHVRRFSALRLETMVTPSSSSSASTKTSKISPISASTTPSSFKNSVVGTRQSDLKPMSMVTHSLVVSVTVPLTMSCSLTPSRLSS